jgi:metallo-beta-lactamase family protein
MESTYGNKCHEGRKERKETLRKVLVSALSNAGTVIIPAFSIGRTQELLYELEELIHRYKNHSLYRHLSWEDLDIVVDSPLANRFTEVYQNLQALWSKEALVKVSSGRHPLSFDNLTTINSHKEHLDCVRYLTKTARPAIVLAASGMCAGGRVAHYLKAMLEDPRHDVLFVGYQAAGTPGRAIQNYGPKNGFVEMDGKKYKIRAKVWTIGGYSAHADQKDLVRFISRMQHRPKVVKLIHGEKKSKIALSKRIREACVKH